MSEQIPFGFDVGFAENPEPRCACVLLLDTSGSMDGQPLEALNHGLMQFRTELSLDGLAALRVEVAVVTFGEEVRVKQDFVAATDFDPELLTASGRTPMSGAILKGLEMVEKRKAVYKANGIGYYRPWIFMITDGAPTDGHLWKQASTQIRQAEENQQVAFFAVAVEGANLETLRQLSRREPLKLKGLQFTDLFMWLSKSLGSSGVSGSQPGDKVALPAPSGWAEI